MKEKDSEGGSRQDPNELRKVVAFTARAVAFIKTLPEEMRWNACIMMLMDLARGVAESDPLITSALLHMACDQNAYNVIQSLTPLDKEDLMDEGLTDD